MKSSISIVGLVAAATLAPAAAQAAEDPFAAETPMAEADLKDARGGMVVAGFVIDFGFDASLIHDAPVDVPGFTYSFDPLLNSFVVNNALDGVHAQHTMTLDVMIPNFDVRVDQASAALAAVDGALDAILLTTGF